MATLMPDGRRRSREHWTDSMEAPPPNPPAHVHRLPKAVRLALVGLVAAVFLLAIALGMVATQLVQVNEYVQGRGEFRDREAARMEAEWQERLRKAQCDLLDQFPEGGWLERPRAKYDCGPGIPIDRLTPEEQQKLLDRAPRQNVAPEPEPEPAPPATPAPFSGGAVGPPATSTQTPPPPRATPSPASPTPAPLVGPLTDTACAVTGVCLEGEP